MKRILGTGILGQKGINLIEGVVLKMGYLWYPSGQLEAGIDGHIEIRDPRSGEVSNSIVLVQSRATDLEFQRENDDSLEYTCDERDLTYWLQGNAPVLLVVSRPRTNEAYWVSLKDYFSDLDKLKKRVVRFDKNKQRLDEGAAEAIRTLAFAEDRGIYTGPAPKKELLYSNILPVQVTSEYIYKAECTVKAPKELWLNLKELGGPIRSDWSLRSGTLLSFFDLTQYPWSALCKPQSVKQIPIEEWSASEVSDQRNAFVSILNQCLRSKMWHQEVLFDEEFEYYYFRPTPDLTPRNINYHSLTLNASRMVFQGYPMKQDPKKIAYYRHSAFDGRFFRYDNQWHLQITPTYHYTKDGKALYRYYEDQLSGIKRLEVNASILGQLLMWADFVSRGPDMFTKGSSYLRFGQLAMLEIDGGLIDDAWLDDEEPEAAEAARRVLQDFPLLNNL